MDDNTRRLALLKRYAAQRDAAYTELHRAFPSGRPCQPLLQKGYDDRKAAYEQAQKACDEIATEIYAANRE